MISNPKNSLAPQSHAYVLCMHMYMMYMQVCILVCILVYMGLYTLPIHAEEPSVDVPDTPTDQPIDQPTNLPTNSQRRQSQSYDTLLPSLDPNDPMYGDLPLHPSNSALRSIARRVWWMQYALQSQTRKNNYTDISWVMMPAGRFLLGCVTQDDECLDHEKNAQYGKEHGKKQYEEQYEDVQSFNMMKTEVTVNMYKNCVDSGICKEPDDRAVNESCNWGYPERGDHPINCVDWYQAVTYCQFIGGRLPSAAEWEYAAKSAGRTQKYPWGDTPSQCTYAVMDEKGDGCGQEHTQTVCSKPAGNSTQGACDLTGNVWEWIANPYKTQIHNAHRVYKTYQEARGGSWVDISTDLRASARLKASIDYRFHNIGFRCVQDF